MLTYSGARAAGALGRCLRGTRRQRALKFGALSSIGAQFLKGCFLKALGESFGRAPGTAARCRRARLGLRARSVWKALAALEGVGSPRT